MALNYYPHFSMKDLKGILKDLTKVLLLFSSFQTTAAAPGCPYIGKRFVFLLLVWLNDNNHKCSASVAQELNPSSHGLWFRPFPESLFCIPKIQYCSGSIYPWSQGQTSSLPSGMLSMRKTMLCTIGVK